MILYIKIREILSLYIGDSFNGKTPVSKTVISSEEVIRVRIPGPPAIKGGRFMNKRNSSAYNRDVSRRKALRKRRIAKEVYYGGKEHPYYDNLHQYSKNKIHCSCPMCSPKTRNKGRRDRKNYQRALNYKASELKRQISMDDEELEYTGSIGHRGSKRKHDW